MISRRYNLFSYYLEDVYDQRRRVLDKHTDEVKQQKLAEGKEYTFLNSLSKNNILAIWHRKVRDLEESN